MKKRLIIASLVALALILSMSVSVFAYVQVQKAISTTQFFACETTATGVVDPATITQNNALTCPAGEAVVMWSVTGPQGVQGIPGPTGATGAQGPQGVPGASGLLFTHAPCAETGLTGSSEQENLLFCQSGVEPDGGFLYQSAIQMAGMTHRIAGTPLVSFPSNDWSGVPITYVEFSSGLHAEFHADDIVRWYSWTSGRLF